MRLRRSLLISNVTGCTGRTVSCLPTSPSSRAGGQHLNMHTSSPCITNIRFHVPYRTRTSSRYRPHAIYRYRFGPSPPVNLVIPPSPRRKTVSVGQSRASANFR